MAHLSRFLTTVASATALSLLTMSSASAHHSFASEFDGSREVTVQGVLTRVSWSNPHIEYEIQATKAGKPMIWTAAALGPTVLKRVGVKKADLRVGSQVKVTGYPAKDGSPHIYGRVIEYPDGLKVMTGLNRTNASDTE